MPKFCVWEITLECNANCKHCASNAGFKRNKELNSREIFDLIEQLKIAGIESIFLSGGEPTLRKDFYDIVKKIESTGMTYGFITNGLVNLNINFLRDHMPSAIGVSIDGVGTTHNKNRGIPNAFNQTWSTILKLVENDLPVSVVTAVGKYNLKDLKRIELDILHNKVGGWQLQVAIPEGRMDPSLTLSEQEYYELCKYIAKEKFELRNILNISAADNLGYYGTLEGELRADPWTGCPAGRNVVGITSNGDIKPCLSIMHPNTIAGNVRKKNFSEIWENDENFAFFRTFKGTEGLCEDCEKSNECRAGCSATMIGFNGELRREYPFCIKRYEGQHMRNFDK
ncbi:MAG: radical SAM/SPASM domain-containing protein [Promethearchaeota archaeon]